MRVRYLSNILQREVRALVYSHHYAPPGHASGKRAGDRVVTVPTARYGGDLDGFTGLDLYKAPLPAIDDAAVERKLAAMRQRGTRGVRRRDVEYDF